MDDRPVFTAVAAGRQGIASLLEGLDDEQLAAPSLCSGLDVHTVGAHLAQVAAPAPAASGRAGAGRRPRAHGQRPACPTDCRPFLAQTVALLRARRQPGSRRRSPARGRP